jgi:serine/threonine protein kinase
MQKESLVGKKLKTYSVIKELGDGACSIVYEGYNSVNKQRVAIKAISFKKMKEIPKLQELVQT